MTTTAHRGGAEDAENRLGSWTPSARAATIALLVLTVVWGGTFFLMEKFLVTLEGRVPGGPVAAGTLFTLLRFGASFLLFPLVMPSCFRGLTASTWVRGAVLGGTAWIGFVLQIVGLASHNVTPALSAFLTSLFVVFTPLLEGLATRKRPAKAAAAGAILALAGAAAMTDWTGADFGIGELLTLGCAAAFGGHILLTDRFTKIEPTGGLTWATFFWAAVYSAIVLLAYPGGRDALFGPGIVVATTEPDALWPLVGITVFATIGAFTVMNVFQRGLTPTRAAVIYTAEPVFAALLSAIFYGEAITVWLVVGAAFILAGNLVCELAGRRKAIPSGERPAGA